MYMYVYMYVLYNFISLLILWELHIMQSNSIHLPFPHILPLPLQHTPERKQKACKQANKEK